MHVADLLVSAIGPATNVLFCSILKDLEHKAPLSEFRVIGAVACKPGFKSYIVKQTVYQQ